MRPRTALVILALGVVAFTMSACERSAVREPSPVGPSTTHLAFSLSANPNVIYAGTQRPTSQIKVVVRDGNNPVMGAVVYFTIISGLGTFSDQTLRSVLSSNENGVASIVFLGPLKSEIAADQDVVIRAQLQTDSPQSIFKDVGLRVLRAPDQP
jgi:hypothetical protein